MQWYHWGVNLWLPQHVLNLRSAKKLLPITNDNSTLLETASTPTYQLHKHFSWSRTKHNSVQDRSAHSRLSWRLRSTNSAAQQQQRNERYRQLRIAILTLVVCGTFILCWTPFAVLFVIWPLFSDDLPSPTMVTIAAICGKSFVIINPIIYSCNDRCWGGRVQLPRNITACRLNEFTSKDQLQVCDKLLRRRVATY